MTRSVVLVAHGKISMPLTEDGAIPALIRPPPQESIALVVPYQPRNLTF
jgi:hypothetical protein